MYMADGGLKEDFLHLANTIAELVKAKCQLGNTTEA